MKSHINLRGDDVFSNLPTIYAKMDLVENYLHRSEWEDSQIECLQPFSRPDIHHTHPNSIPKDLKEPPNLQLEDIHWQPSYLQRLVLLGFTTLFALILVASEVLQKLSQRNHGLATSYPGLHYLWTYGPTAVLTLVASFWYRIEFQTKMITPWARIFNRSDKASTSLLQDYLSSSPPTLLRHAVKNRDCAVLATATVSLLMKLLIVLSSGLITLSSTKVPVENVLITLKDTFVDSNIKLQSSDQSLPFYIMQGLLRGDIGVPVGITPDFAYQTIDTTNSALESSSQVEATVDGLTNSLECESANLSLIYAVPPIRYLPDGLYTNLTATSSSCSALFKLPGPSWNQTDRVSNSSLAYFARLATSQCTGTSGDSGMRLLIWFGLMNYTNDYFHTYSDMGGGGYPIPFGKLVRSTQLLCTPSYRLTKVDVIQNGTQTLSLSENSAASNSTLSSVHPWQLMQAHLDSYENSAQSTSYSVLGSDYVNITNSQQQIDVDQYMNVSLTMYVPSRTSIERFYDPDFLVNITNLYYQQYTAIIAKQSLMSSDATTNATAPLAAVGSYVAMRNRLVVRVWSAQWMAGLLTICLLLSLALIFILPGHSVVPRNPSTLHGMAALVANSQYLLEDLQDAGNGKETLLKKNLKASTFSLDAFVAPHVDPKISAQFFIKRKTGNDSEDSTGPRLPQTKAKNITPTMLRSRTRLLIAFVTIGLIITLELLLFKSRSKGCLGYVIDDTYIHYAWTVVPALIFAALATVFAAFDFAIRSVMPYARLKRMVSVEEFMNLEFLDSSVLTIMYRQMRLRYFPPLAATTSLLIASLFTIFSASLFQALPRAVTVPVSLQVVNSFSLTANPEASSQEVASFVLQGLYTTYPQWTWEGMAFPEFNLKGAWPSGAMSLDSPEYILETIIPTIRSSMTCQMYDSSVIQYNLSVGFVGNSVYWGFNMTNTLGVIIEGENCELDRSVTDDYIGYNAYFSTQNNGYFGFGMATDKATIAQGCSKLLYVWGHVNYNVTPPVTFISAMGCNQTFESVDVRTKFKGTNFTMTPDAPPVPIEATTRNTTALPGLSLTPLADPYSYLPRVPAGSPADQFDAFFGLLMSSPQNTLSTSTLSATDQISSIAAAIQYQHGIIQAQNLVGNWVPANESNSTLPSGVSGRTDADFTYAGNLTDPLGGGRGLCISQDAASTHILAALLGIALLLFVISWIGMPESAIAVLPRQTPLSIASAVALIAGGNLVSFLPPNADSCTDEEIKRSLGSERGVWLGWANMPDEEGRMAGQENEGGVSRFGVFVVEREMMDEVKGKKYRKLGG
ncbi:hypothetical protein PVAG01_03374 [Phlyctema vagabunda]|uniref:Uncharacterized protein n=1 Tax=Phlyctema vagabunda TaxID=108571 RepID=A0ABR4PL95_9HELO